MPVPVVRRPFMVVDEDLVRFAEFLELLLGNRVARILVRVVLTDELSVGLLELVRRRVFRHAERLVQRASHLCPS